MVIGEICLSHTSLGAGMSSFVAWLYSVACFCFKWQNKFVSSVFSGNSFLSLFCALLEIIEVATF